MPQMKFTTMIVYEKDKETLLQIHGGAAHEAFHKIVINTCTHPEEKRSYVMADLPAIGETTITSGAKPRKVGGFYCAGCGLYIFRGVALLPTGA